MWGASCPHALLTGTRPESELFDLETHGCGDRPIRMGFMLDIVGYGRRDTPAKESLQRRLAGVARMVFEDLTLSLSDIDCQGMGDGLLVVLPAQLGVQRVLPALLQSMAERLTLDNALSHDQMRVRMAVDVGPVVVTALGFGGAMVTNMGRLLNSRPLRRREAEHRERDLAAAISDSLHRFVVAEGVPTLAREQFTRVQVRAKELSTTAWLWTR